MADDMSAPNGSFDPIAQWARLSERVENQGKDIIDLRSNMNTGFQNIQSALTSLMNEFRGSTRTQWPVIWSAIGVCFVVITAIGGLAYAPITSGMTRLDQSLSSISEKMVTRQEMDWRAQRGVEDRLKTDAAIVDLRAGVVPRQELDRVWAGYDQRFTDMQRQIDETNSRYSNTYTLGDYIKRLTERMDMLEQRTMRSTSPGG